MWSKGVNYFLLKIISVAKGSPEPPMPLKQDTTISKSEKDKFNKVMVMGQYLTDVKIEFLTEKL